MCLYDSCKIVSSKDPLLHTPTSPPQKQLTTMKATANGSCPLHPEHQGRTEIKDALQHHIDATSSELTDDDPDRSFFVADLGEIYRCYNKWKLWLPRIKPFYGTVIK